MYINENIIVNSFELTGKGTVLVTNLDYDRESYRFTKGDTIKYSDKLYEILSVEASLMAEGNIKKDVVAFIVREVLKKATQVVLINEEGEVLCVSRKTDHNDFGLPGGKVDPEDENEMAAAIREAKEETGLDISDLRLIFAMHRNNYMGYTYLAKYSGEINHNEPHIVKWAPIELVKQGSFGRFNTLVAESLDNMGIKHKK